MMMVVFVIFKINLQKTYKLSALLQNETIKWHLHMLNLYYYKKFHSLDFFRLKYKLNS